MDRFGIDVLFAGAALALVLVSGAHAETEAAANTDFLSELGSFERRAVLRVLRDHEWRIEPEPARKEIAEIHVVTLPVFGQRSASSLQWFNRFHATTKPEIIRREILLDPGDRWRPKRIAETERNLRNPVFTSLAVAVPVRSDEPGTVDLVVVTRDIWSLRPGFNFEYQNGIFSELTLFLSENNLLGRHKSVHAAFEMGLGSWQIGPRFYDPRLFGTRLELLTEAQAVFTRGTGAYEGTKSETTLRYPLWNLQRTWGGEVSVVHRDVLVREFRGAEPLPYDDPRTPERESVPWVYRSRQLDLEGMVRYATGTEFEHRISLGYRLELQDPEFPAGFSGDFGLRRAFRRDVMPPRERNSGPFAEYYLFQPKWITYRNIDTYELPEETAIGPYVRVRVAPMLEAFGSLRSFLAGEGTAGWTFDLGGDGFARLETGASGRFWAGDFFDNNVYGLVQVAAPEMFETARLVVRGQVDAYLEDTQNRILVAGGQTGLRGYEIGAFTGERRVLGNVELRTSPAALGSFEVGALAFWDVGGAGRRFSALPVRNDLGIGLRLVIPQFQTKPVRIDWAFPVARGRSAWPGRLSIGFGQIF